MEFLPYISLVFALGVLWRQEILIRRNRRERRESRDLHCPSPWACPVCAPLLAERRNFTK